MGATKPVRTHNPKTCRVSVHITEDFHARLLKATQAEGLTKTSLSRTLIAHGLAELERGNKEIHRAIKTSRDS